MTIQNATQPSQILAKFILLVFLAVFIHNQTSLTPSTFTLEYNNFLELDNNDLDLDNLHVSMLTIQPIIECNLHQHTYTTQLTNRTAITPSQRAPPICTTMLKKLYISKI